VTETSELNECLKEHKNELFCTFFAEAKFVWSQGPEDKILENCDLFDRNISLFSNFRVDSVCSKIVSDLAQPAINNFRVWPASEKNRSSYTLKIPKIK